MNFLPYTISNYSLKEHQSMNISGLRKDATMFCVHRNVDYPTDDMEKFDKYSYAYIRECMDKQFENLKKKIDLQLEYRMISKSEYRRSLVQYEEIFFVSFDDDPNNPTFVGFDKKELEKYKKLEIQKAQVKKEFETITPPENPLSFVGTPKKIRHKLPKEEEVDYDEYDEDDDERNGFDSVPRLATHIDENTIGVSVSALRKITGYSYYVQLSWHKKPQEVTWQKKMIEDNSNFLVVDGSRQGGKSFAISQKVFEESFIVGADMMVAAFQQDTTEVIWDYLLDLIEKMPEGDFTIKERKRYIQNNHTGTRIHFRTLQNGAKGIRGKTLRFIVVDEAMLISDDIFESILLPTQTTIDNPKMILLGTASANTSCFMYKLIRDIRRGEKYNNENQYTAKHIKFSILENPFASPKMVQYALDNKDDPRVRREYFNKWGKIDEALFQYETISLLNIQPDTSHTLVLSVDPARKKDRAGYAILLAGNNKVLLLESGEIPSHFKQTWSLQGAFLNKIRQKYHAFPHIITAGDETGVGDGAFEVFELAAGFTIDKRVHYVAGVSEGENKEKTIFHTGKSLLINNTLDFITEKNLLIVKETNQDLLEEGDSLEETINSLGHIGFKTAFFDDITNAMMIGLYIVKKFSLHRKSKVKEIPERNLLKEEFSIYENKGFSKKFATRVA